MSKSVGGVKGVGSLCVHDYRNMSVKSDYLLPSWESCFLHNRFDCSEVMQNLALEYHMEEDLIIKFYSHDNAPLNDQLEKCLKSATYIPMSLTYSIKKHLENFGDTNFNGLYIAHKFYEPCLSNLIKLPLICYTIDYHISLAMLLVMKISALKESFLQKRLQIVTIYERIDPIKSYQCSICRNSQTFEVKTGDKN